MGADGVVVLVPPTRPGRADVSIRYYNADGSVATLCGNATLCTVSLAAELGFKKDGNDSVRIEVGDRVVNGRLADGVPEFELGDVERIDPSPPVDLDTGERRIGYAIAGVPHFVVLVDDVEVVDLVDAWPIFAAPPERRPARCERQFRRSGPERVLDTHIRAWRRRRDSRMRDRSSGLGGAACCVGRGKRHGTDSSLDPLRRTAGRSPRGQRGYAAESIRDIAW